MDENREDSLEQRIRACKSSSTLLPNSRCPVCPAAFACKCQHLCTTAGSHPPNISQNKQHKIKKMQRNRNLKTSPAHRDLLQNPDLQQSEQILQQLDLFAAHKTQLCFFNLCRNTFFPPLKPCKHLRSVFIDHMQTYAKERSDGKRAHLTAREQTDQYNSPTNAQIFTCTRRMFRLYVWTLSGKQSMLQLVFQEQNLH